ncbi:MAG TPA: lipopolysaccharide kinase InaA family protein [Pirellulales bacterium]|nr:lipopolysaccharide kinase InaA family protein [Pirellulales bacterium]
MTDRPHLCLRFDGSHARQKPAAGLRRHSDGRMWVDLEYEEELKRLGLTGFDAVMHSSQGQLLRTLPDRENWRLELAADGRQHILFLKKHRTRSLIERFSWLLGRTTTTPGRIEAENVVALQRAGIESMRVVAFGEHVRRGATESFFMTEGLRGFVQLDHFLRQRFVPAAERTRADGELTSLVASVADVARRFHTAGFNHRDFYCCHFFIHESPGSRFAVRLIDLQRVEKRRWWRERWIVKDLAQLAYSAPRERITNTLRMRFIKQYLGVDRLGPAGKRLVRRILRRQHAMQRKLGAHP